MDNESYLKKLQLSYDSMKYFLLKDNVLYFKNNENIYSLPLTISLASLNPNLFINNPINIYRIIYILTLLKKDQINDQEKDFIIDYVKHYLVIEKDRIENKEIDENELMSLSIPIYTSYDPNYNNHPASVLIQEQLNNYANEIESGKSHGQKLVLTNPNIPKTIDDDDLYDLGKAGFGITILIVSTVILTSLYIFFFLLNK